ncbi:ribonuclease HI family protein [Acidovorax delafieldii]|uniref:ribonuclease HI family protein n=1 Tax=Acidovorax delafieldii TaxID=47920 RepID=UPI003ED0E0DF
MTAARAAAPLAPGAWVIHCDGSAGPNPGRMGLGAVLTGPDGTVRHQISEATTFTGCNNEAELRALMLALQWLAQQGIATSTQVHLFSDNRVLVEQLGSHPKAPIERLAALFDEAHQALRQFPQAHVQWIPRHRNGAADTLARAALGLAPKAATPQSQTIKKRRRR